ncbi:AraC family transcriptional regulator [Pseudovibrio exalbescens]|uniref:helix-turn-helix domain-containing protein n=1 Tax=Pseudovibrio exalbescens TaxID=197461 RepID=UPI002365E08B|nr:AraC family transcriptional regulator [Pseudovibrio exalbescens]MDD7910966.1 AraC family transcriptional regulator [Pseudovibrio exalbescens]
MRAPQPVSRFLSSSPCARLVGAMDLGADRSTAIWRNQDDHMLYTAPKGHTFSFYLQNGTGTRRVDSVSARGWEGAVVVLPEGCTSEWEITTPFEFIHLYLSDEELRRLYFETFDKDARLMNLTDLTYFETPALSQGFRALHLASVHGAAGHADEAISEIVHALFSDGRALSEHKKQLSGGLSPRKLSLLREFMDAHLGRPVTLRELAAEVDMSEFHTQRSFRASTGVSPAGWMVRRRIERAKEMLRAGEPMAQISEACGFANQSHFSRSFKRATGASPKDFLRCL